MRVDRLALRIAIILAILSSILGILIEIIPIANFNGLINGYLAIIWYDLKYDGENLYLPFFNAIIIRGIFSIIGSLLLLISAVYISIELWKKKELKYTRKANSYFIAFSLVNLFLSTLPIQSYQLAIRMLKALNNSISTSLTTSAGTLHLYSPTLNIFDMNWLIITNIIIAILIVALSIYPMFKEREELHELTKKEIEVPVIARNLEEYQKDQKES